MLVIRNVLGNFGLLKHNIRQVLFTMRLVNWWWRHQMETFSALLAFCVGNSTVTGEFPAQRPVTPSFDVFFDLRLNKRLRKQSRCRWFKTPSRSLWRPCNVFPIAALAFLIRRLVWLPHHYRTRQEFLWCNFRIRYFKYVIQQVWKYTCNWWRTNVLSPADIDVIYMNSSNDT